MLSPRDAFLSFTHGMTEHPGQSGGSSQSGGSGHPGGSGHSGSCCHPGHNLHNLHFAIIFNFIQRIFGRIFSLVYIPNPT